MQGDRIVRYGQVIGAAAVPIAAGSWVREEMVSLPEAPPGPGTTAWTGSELIGWGGGCCGDAWSGGSAYDPATDAWRTLARTPLAPGVSAQLPAFP